MAVPASLTEQLDNLYTTTWRYRMKEVQDAIFDATPFWAFIAAKGRRRTIAGHRSILVPIMYDKSKTVTSIAKGDTISTTENEFLTMANYNWKIIAGSVVRYWEDDRQNRGQAAILSLLNAKMDNLRLTITDKFEVDLFLDGTGNGGKDIGGLSLYVPTVPTSGTIGGINRANFSWWRSKTKTATGSFAVYGKDELRTAINDCTTGADSPDLLLTDQTDWERLATETEDQKSIVNQKVGDSVFDSIRFWGRDVMWSPSCSPANAFYLINTKYLEWIADEYANFTMTEWKAIPNQLDRVAQVVVVGNLVLSNSRKQGIYHTITA